MIEALFISTLAVSMFSPLGEYLCRRCNGSASVSDRQATQRTVYRVSILENFFSQRADRLL